LPPNIENDISEILPPRAMIKAICINSWITELINEINNIPSLSKQVVSKIRAKKVKLNSILVDFILNCI
jgi:23S rRNA A1618 N6-methylase RlmF